MPRPTDFDRAQVLPHDRMGRPRDTAGDRGVVDLGNLPGKGDHPLNV